MRSLLALALVLSFSTWATLHLVLVWRLLFREPRWLSLLALLPPLAPLAPYWGYQLGLRRMVLFWGIALAAYGAMLTLGFAVAQ